MVRSAISNQADRFHRPVHVLGWHRNYFTHTRIWEWGGSDAQYWRRLSVGTGRPGWGASGYRRWQRDWMATVDALCALWRARSLTVLLGCRDDPPPDLWGEPLGPLLKILPILA